MKVEQGGCFKMWLQQTDKELAVEGKRQEEIERTPGDCDEQFNKCR